MLKRLHADHTDGRLIRRFTRKRHVGVGQGLPTSGCTWSTPWPSALSLPPSPLPAVLPPRATEMSLLGLSHELLVHILSYLDYEHLQVARRLNHAIDRLIQSSILLQYSMQLQLYGYEDNPSCHLVISDKLRLLRQQENAWSRLDFEKETTIRIPFNPSSIYDLTDGVLLLGESVSGIQTGADTVRWTRLSQLVSSEDAPAAHFWEKIDVGAHIIDVGLSVEEHDLIVVATECVAPQPGSSDSSEES